MSSVIRPRKNLPRAVRPVLRLPAVPCTHAVIRLVLVPVAHTHHTSGPVLQIPFRACLFGVVSAARVRR
eukprot:12937706-Prorocentrum_lima.AAC.1